MCYIIYRERDMTEIADININSNMKGVLNMMGLGNTIGLTTGVIGVVIASHFLLLALVMVNIVFTYRYFEAYHNGSMWVKYEKARCRGNYMGVFRTPLTGTSLEKRGSIDLIVGLIALAIAIYMVVMLVIGITETGSYLDAILVTINKVKMMIK